MKSTVPLERVQPAEPTSAESSVIRRYYALGLARATQYRWLLLLAGAYLLPVLYISRLEIVAGPGQFPQGTNALNAFLYYDQWKLYPLQTWYSPFTDWGLPVPGFTGPSPLYVGTLTLSPATLVRLVELVSLWFSGVSAYALLRRVKANQVGAFAGGFYYMLMAQTPQFFEGHVPSMVSIAVAPIYFLALYTFASRLDLRWGVVSAISLYFLAAAGDLGFLYFFLFFSLPLVVFAIVRNRTYAHLGPSQVFAVLAASLLFVVLMAPWWCPFVLGVRPQYTTNIVATVLPFSSTVGNPIALAFAGMSAQNSFIHFGLGRTYYALDYSTLADFYLILPVAIAVYAVLKRSAPKLLLYAGGLLAMFISTAGQYAGISTFNNFLYDHIPFFNYIPLLSSWVAITVLVYSIFVAWIITDVHAWVQRPVTNPERSSTRRTRYLEETTWVTASAVVVRRRIGFRRTLWRGWWSPPTRVRWVCVAAIVALVLAGVVVQNQATFSSPPTYFSFPDQYILGYDYVRDQPAEGGVLTVPFSAIYERTPWAGVSVSTTVLATYFTNSNAAVFEAGNPYSLAMDEYIAHALTYGTSGNLTKFLRATNIQFVTATDYPDWAQSSSSFFSPRVQYENLQRQVALGNPVFTGGYQSVYQLANPSGNLSFDPTYYVFFGNNTLVNEISNDPLYNGTQPLINGSQVAPGDLSAFVRHAAAVFVAPGSFSGIPPGILADAVDSNIPVIEIAGGVNLVGHPPIHDPWNASNGLAAQPGIGPTPIAFEVNQSALLQAGGTALGGTVRASCPSGALLSLDDGPASYNIVYPDPTREYLPLNFTNTSVVSAGINNQGKYHYNGSISALYTDGVPSLEWNFTPKNSTFQYLNFDTHSLSGAVGMTLTFGNASGAPSDFLFQVLFNNTFVNVPGYRSEGTAGSAGTTYTFLFSEGAGPGAASLSAHLGSLTRFVLGMLQTGSASQLDVTNVSILHQASSGTPYRNFPMPTLGFGTSGAVEVNATQLCKIDFLTFSTESSQPSQRSFASYTGRQPDPLSLSAVAASGGWGVLVASQTFDPGWQLTVNRSVAGIHTVANLGLNAWLLNLTPNSTIVVQYLGQSYLAVGLGIEAIGIPIVAAGMIIRRSRQRKTYPTTGSGKIQG